MNELALESERLPKSPSRRRAPPFVVAPAGGGLRLDFTEIWKFRELLLFLSWRDLKVRYRQTALGAAWAILQPLAAMVVFSVVFGRLARMPSDGVPYPIFTFAALLPWNLFSGALTRTTTSVTMSANLISKVYFPRVLLPLSATAGALADFACSFVILAGMMLWYGIGPTWRLVAVPPLILLAIGTSLGIGFWLAALNVKYRDIGYVVPFLIQIGLYVSPVAYSSSIVPDRWQWLYGLNPLVGVIEGFRWALVGTTWTPGGLVALSVGVMTLVFVAGLAYFQRMEDTFADIV